MNTFQLDILTPKGHAFTGEAESVVAPATDGYLGVQANHAPLIVALKPGILSVKDSSTERIFSVDSGVMEVSPDNNVSLLVDEAVVCENNEEAKLKVKEFKDR